jgi:hypothetical protein
MPARRPSDHQRRRVPRVAASLGVVVATLLFLAAPAGAAAQQTRTVTPIMGKERVTANEIVAWYKSKNIRDAKPAVSVETLARLFIEEGRTEGVAGDLAFVQAMVETGWLRHSTRVPPHFYNYAGIGAVDGGSTAARFPNARIGVRAQIQHLRAYADHRVNCRNFKHPTVTPRCHLVLPKGKAPMWEDMGRGNWATDPQYAAKINRLYDELLTHAGKPLK